MNNIIKNCRLCKSKDLQKILDMGIMSFTGIFPKYKDEDIPSDNMSLAKCTNCGLVQLEQLYNLNILYGDTYGYRSGLNKSMEKHLNDIVSKCKRIVDLKDDDIVLDIGSNDGTLLNSYGMKNINKWGIDPLIKKFHIYYEKDIKTVNDFFNKDNYINNIGSKKAKIITSIAMFYDLVDPLKFSYDIADILDVNGIWLTEQSYFPSMINTNSYDTICQEHLEYYCLKQIYYIAKKINLKIIDVEFNNANGGSFQVIMAHKTSQFNECKDTIKKILEKEKQDGYDGTSPIDKLKENMVLHKEKLLKFLNDAKLNKKIVYGYGASTKGNVLLQYCNITTDLLPKIAEVNSDKFGSYTPKSLIPIIDEVVAKREKPDYFLVLPWHFKNNIITREKEYLASGGKLVFPLPVFEIYDTSCEEKHT